MLSRSQDVRRATDITPIGLIADRRGVPLNVDDFGLIPRSVPEERPPTIAVVGTSMNAGKTTAIHRLVHALARAGHRPGATKVTGTGSGADYWVMLDAGAHRMLDFTDVGLASTYRVDMAIVERKAVELTGHLAHSRCGAIVVEVADGLFQGETARLIDSESFRSRIDGWILAATDAMGAVGGSVVLQGLGLRVVGLAGRFTRSPLAVREVSNACDLPILAPHRLSDVATASSLFGLEAPPKRITSSIGLDAPLEAVPSSGREVESAV
jgi:hypothetical protein